MLFGTTSSDYRQFMANEGRAPPREFPKPDVPMEFRTTSSDYQPANGFTPAAPPARPAMQFDRTTDDFAASAAAAATATAAANGDSAKRLVECFPPCFSLPLLTNQRGRWGWQQPAAKPAMQFERTSDRKSVV